MSAESFENKTEYVDVPGLFNNCFFHCLALHYLTNDLSLPTDLFAVHERDESLHLYVQLKAIIEEDKDSFFEKHLGKKPSEYSFLVEKTTVLAFLFRSLYVDRLLKNKDMPRKLFKSENKDNLSQTPFLGLIEHKKTELETRKKIIELTENSLYLKYKGFFETLGTRSFESFKENISENILKLGFLSSKEYQSFLSFAEQLASLKDKESNPTYLEHRCFFDSLENKTNISTLCETYWLKKNEASYREFLLLAKGILDFSIAAETFRTVVNADSDLIHQEPIYASNKIFFDNLSIEALDKYTDDVYWQEWSEKVYPTYCEFLLNGIPISVGEIQFFLNQLGINFRILRTDESLVEENIVEGSPLFQIKMVAGAGHYFLAKTDKSGKLKIYEDEWASYILFRDGLAPLFVEYAKPVQKPPLADVFKINSGVSYTNPLQTLIRSLGNIKEQEMVPATNEQNELNASLFLKSLESLQKVAKENLDEDKYRLLMRKANLYQAAIITELQGEGKDITPLTNTFLKESKALLTMDKKGLKIFAAVVMFAVAAVALFTFGFLLGGLAGLWAVSMAAFVLAFKASTTIAFLAAVTTVALSTIGSVATGVLTANKFGLFKNTDMVTSAIDDVANEAKRSVVAFN